MICYRDRTFCSDADICQNKDACGRWFSTVERANAVRWWRGEDVPVAFMSFKETCNYFKKDVK